MPQRLLGALLNAKANSPVLAIVFGCPCPLVFAGISSLTGVVDRMRFGRAICHTDCVMYGTIKAKWRGLYHVYVQYFGNPTPPLHLYHAYNRECLHCHLGSRSFEEGTAHTADPEIMADIKSNKISCLTSGCHDQVHNTMKLTEVKYWGER